MRLRSKLLLVSAVMGGLAAAAFALAYASVLQVKED